MFSRRTLLSAVVLSAAGWAVLPIPAGDVTADPAGVVEVVRAALARHR